MRAVDIMDLETLIGLLEQEAIRHDIATVRVDIKEIQPDESIALKCLIPLCEHYGRVKVCPPYIPKVDEFRKALEKYQAALLVVLRRRVEDVAAYRHDHSGEIALLEAVHALETLAFRRGWYRAAGLVVGGCHLCPRCTPPGEPCLNPYKARPSPEGLGIDVTGLARRFGVPIQWPPTDELAFLGLLLL